MSCVTLTNEQLIAQIEASLIKYGMADANGVRALQQQLRKGINRLVDEAISRGINIPWIRHL